MAEEKKYMPQSGAGLMRYFDEEEAVKIKPQYVVAASVTLAAVILVMKFLV